jgi:hypothetical protein
MYWRNSKKYYNFAYVLIAFANPLLFKHPIQNSPYSPAQAAAVAFIEVRCVFPPLWQVKKGNQLLSFHKIRSLYELIKNFTRISPRICSASGS